VTHHWSWTVRVKQGDPGYRVHSTEALMAAVAGALMAEGTDSRMADTFARSVRERANEQSQQRRMNHATPPLEYQQILGATKVLHITSDDLPEDPDRYCEGRTESGSRCPRHLNHLGECK